MAKKLKVPEIPDKPMVAITPTEEQAKEMVVDTLIAECDAVDMHSLGVDGKPDEPKCALEKGHAGDHKATHKMRVEKKKVYDLVYGKHIDTEYEIVDGDVFWGDAAGVPAKDIKKSEMPVRDGGRRDEIRKTIDELMRV